MKYLVAVVLLLSLTSCYVVEDEYYGRGYYAPPPRVEVVPNYPRDRYYGHPGYRQVQRARVYEEGASGAVVVNRGVVHPRYRGQGNVHGHNGGNNVQGHTGGSNVHGHTNANNVHGHPQSTGSQVQVQQNVHGHEPAAQNVHGHADTTNQIRRPTQTASSEDSRTTRHGHN